MGSTYNLTIAHVRPKCCYKGVSIYTSGPAKLDRWGIDAGGTRIALIVVPKGRKLSISLGRDGLIGWNQSDAEAEFQENMPELLKSFMRVFDAKTLEPEDQVVNDIIQQWLNDRGIGLGPEKRERKKPDPNRIIKPRVRIEKDDEDEDAKPRKGKKGAPTPYFARAEATGGASIVYNSVKNRLLINVDSDYFKSGIDVALQSRKVTDFRVMVGVSVVSGWVNHLRHFPHMGTPTTEVLEGIYMGARSFTPCCEGNWFFA